jgi:N-hydroxyarylamine O-acetyltransferase
MDVAAYLRRIDYHGPVVPAVETLHGLHKAHLMAVPFENLDIALGRPIVLEEEQLFEKIVNRRRGGFCYELNGLFAALLRELGFRVYRLAARVANSEGGYGIEFDHMTLLVHLEESWLADVGFGDSFIQPLRLDERMEQVQEKGRYRITALDDSLLYLRFEYEEWIPQYIFTLQPHPLSAFEGGCQYHQSSPLSSFTQKRVCSRPTPDGRITLSDMTLICTSGENRLERRLKDEAEVKSTLWSEFGVEL